MVSYTAHCRANHLCTHQRGSRRALHIHGVVYYVHNSTAAKALKGRTPHKHTRYTYGDKLHVSHTHAFGVLYAIVELKECLIKLVDQVTVRDNEFIFIGYRYQRHGYSAGTKIGGSWLGQDIVFFVDGLPPLTGLWSLRSDPAGYRRKRLRRLATAQCPCRENRHCTECAPVKPVEAGFERNEEGVQVVQYPL
jgi:hypothetical protein